MKTMAIQGELQDKVLAVLRRTRLFEALNEDQLRTAAGQANLLHRIGGGRVAALEILVGSAAVSNLIREGTTHQIASAMQTGKAAGNQLLNDALVALVNAGFPPSATDADEALSKAVEKTELARRLGLN